MEKKNTNKAMQRPSDVLRTPNIEANGLKYPLGRIIDASQKLDQVIEKKIKEGKMCSERERRWLENESLKYPAKLRLSKAIFAWCKKFVKSDEYGQLIKIRESSLGPSRRMYSSFNRLVNPSSRRTLYKDGLGLVKMGSDEGNYQCKCCSEIIISDNRRHLLYMHRQRFVSQPVVVFKNPRELARGLNYEYLTKFYKSIISGKLKKDLWAALLEDIEDEVDWQG